MYFLTQFVLDKVTVCRLLFDLPLTNSFAQTLRETHFLCIEEVQLVCQVREVSFWADQFHLRSFKRDCWENNIKG